ncbi:MAG: riboflavin synthase [Bacteroidales bacterium]
MFTGIIEKMAEVIAIEKDHTNVHFTLKSALAQELKIDQSLAHNGVCLTVVKIDKDKSTYVVTAMQESLDRSNLAYWKVGDKINLERSMPVNGRFDGHLVQGHVDQTAVCSKIENLDGSWKYYFTYEDKKSNFTVEKGSICVNGVSLTVVDSQAGLFSVAIIPYTYHETNFHQIQKGSVINIEFDILGKYIIRLFEEYEKAK